MLHDTIPYALDFDSPARHDSAINLTARGQVALSRCDASVTKEFSGPLRQIRRLFMNGTAHSIRSISSSVILLLAISAHAATVWDGPTISFTKSDYANPFLAENQDRLTANVWITRGT